MSNPAMPLLGNICIMSPEHTLAPDFTILRNEWVLLESFCLELGHKTKDRLFQMIPKAQTLCEHTGGVLNGSSSFNHPPSSGKRTSPLVTPRLEPPTFAITAALINHTISVPDLELGR